PRKHPPLPTMRPRRDRTVPISLAPSRIPPRVFVSAVARMEGRLLRPVIRDRPIHVTMLYLETLAPECATSPPYPPGIRGKVGRGAVALSGLRAQPILRIISTRRSHRRPRSAPWRPAPAESPPQPPCGRRLRPQRRSRRD